MYVGSQAGAVGTPTHAIYELSKGKVFVSEYDPLN